MVPAPTLAARIGSLSLRAARLGAIAYCLVILLLLFLENLLIYPAPRYPVGDWDATWLPHEDVYFQSADGTKLHGWYVEHPDAKVVILYCHGNGEHVAYQADLLQEMRDAYQASIFAFDYRGYGRSEGKPGEQGILEDGEAAQAWLAERAGIRQEDVVLMGRSLGGGVVIHLAATKGARGVILQNTFTSLPDAAARMYPWAPVRLLMRNRYESLAKIARYHGPLLQSHGTADSLVPFDLGRKLFAAAPGPKEFFEIPGGDHNDIEPPSYYAALRSFLHSLPVRTPARTASID